MPDMLICPDCGYAIVDGNGEEIHNAICEKRKERVHREQLDKLVKEWHDSMGKLQIIPTMQIIRTEPKEYIILEYDDTLALTRAVEKKLAEGWHLQGGIALSCCTNGIEGYLCMQAMVK